AAKTKGRRATAGHCGTAARPRARAGLGAGGRVAAVAPPAAGLAEKNGTERHNPPQPLLKGVADQRDVVAAIECAREGGTQIAKRFAPIPLTRRAGRHGRGRTKRSAIGWLVATGYDFWELHDVRPHLRSPQG